MEQNWKIPEYEERLLFIKEINNLIDNPESGRLLTEQKFWEDLKVELFDSKTRAYAFLRFYADSDEKVQFFRGESSEQYAIFLGDYSEAGYPQLLFFNHRKVPVHLPRLAITSGEKFEEIPTRDFVLAVIDLF